MFVAADSRSRGVAPSISFISSATAGAATVAIPAHNIGDLLVITGWTASATVPTLGAGFTNIISTTAATAVSGRVGYRIATATNDTSGTWTNAVSLCVLIYRGAGAPSASASGTGSSTALLYPALTLNTFQPWVLRPGGCLAAGNVNSTTALSPYVDRQTSNTHLAYWDSNGNVSSAVQVSQSIDTSGAWIGFSIEIPGP